ncbi:MAG TPA: helix-turn-helix domain-containing protein [Candidatus Binatia bacterium]|nr:helix-turn-helix domain-containing protein [Candidatus Binatia bacterium]
MCNSTTTHIHTTSANAYIKLKGIAHARKEGRLHGRPPTTRREATRVKRLYARGVSKAAIARRLKIGRASVRRILS